MSKPLILRRVVVAVEDSDGNQAYVLGRVRRNTNLVVKSEWHHGEKMGVTVVIDDLEDCHFATNADAQLALEQITGEQ